MRYTRFMDDPYNLKPLWDALLEIYQEFACICEKHGLRHYAAGGTALGAARHNGFIPWDDDMDFVMPRPEYEQFLSIADVELPKHLKIVTWRNSAGFPYLFCKIIDCREEKVLAVETQIGRMLSGGLFVDVYPMDGYPTCGFKRIYLKVRDAVLAPLERYRLHEARELTPRGRKARIVGAFESIFIPWLRTQDQFMSLHEKTLLESPWKESVKLVTDIAFKMNAWGMPPIPKDILGTPTPHIFNDTSIMVPQFLEKYLAGKFGDYMKLPPEETRMPSHQYDWRCAWWLGPTAR